MKVLGVAPLGVLLLAISVVLAAKAQSGASPIGPERLALLVGGDDPPPPPKFDCVQRTVCKNASGNDCPLQSDCVRDDGFCTEWRSPPNQQCKSDPQGPLEHCLTEAAGGGCRTKWRNPCEPHPALAHCDIKVEDCGVAFKCNTSP
jgi:hypothetical protein